MAFYNSSNYSTKPSNSTGGIGAIKDARGRLGKLDQDTEANIQKQFAASRTGLGAAQAATQQNIENDLTRQEAASVGGFGGASAMMRQKARANADQGYAAQGADLNAQEASAMMGQKNAEAGREMQLGQLEQGATQFTEQLGQQAQQFADTMKYQWSELGENQKTNMINAWIALKDAGFLDYNQDELNNIYSSGLSGLWGSSVPSGPTQSANSVNGVPKPTGTYAEDPEGWRKWFNAGGK